MGETPKGMTGDVDEPGERGGCMTKHFERKGTKVHLQIKREEVGKHTR